MSVEEQLLTPDLTMGEVMARVPGARRALFRRYHVGGCSSCGFQMTETLGGVAARNELDIAEVLEHLRSSHEQDQKLLLSPVELKALMDRNEPLTLIDIRSREEHEAVSIPGSVFFTQEKMQELRNNADKNALLVFYDHEGKHVLDAASFFEGHGFSRVKCLHGGIDAWARDVDLQMPRYRLE